MSEESRRGVLRVTTELLHKLLKLPDDVQLVDVDVEHNASGWRNRPCKAVVFMLRGEGLPLVPDKERCPIVTVVYEQATAVRFVRFEKIDDE